MDPVDSQVLTTVAAVSLSQLECNADGPSGTKVLRIVNVEYKTITGSVITLTD